MGYEAATYTNELVATNPVGASDREGQGYLHIQNIKTALKNTFPNASSPLTATQAALNAYAGLTADVGELNKMSGVTATTAEINYLSGVTSPIQAQLDSKGTGFSIVTYYGVTSNFNATAWTHYVIDQPSISTTTVNLPASATPGDKIIVTSANDVTTRYVRVRLSGVTIDTLGESEVKQSRQYIWVDDTSKWTKGGA